MVMDALTAANAYRNQLKLQQDITDAPTQDNGPSFSGMVKDSLQDAIATQYKTEDIKLQALTGKVELSDLVTAVSDAELTLNTVVAIRDRVISAYQDIIRMPI